MPREHSALLSGHDDARDRNHGNWVCSVNARSDTPFFRAVQRGECLWRAGSRKRLQVFVHSGNSRAPSRTIVYFLARTCSNTNTPFLLAVTMSSSLSPLTSATTNCVPMPESSSIRCGMKRDQAVAALLGLEPVELGRRVGVGVALGAVRPPALAGDEVLQAVAVDVHEVHARASATPAWGTGPCARTR